MRTRFGIVVLALALIMPIEAAQPVGFSQAAGWDRVVQSVLSLFDHYEIVTLGEAHLRPVDAELRLRLVRHPEFPRLVRVIVTESDDAQLAAAVDGLNRELPEAERVRVMTGGAEPVSVILEQVAHGARVLVVYGAGHLWKREGRITEGLRKNQRRVSVVQTLASPTPADTLTTVEKFMGGPERPVLFSLRGTPIARTPAQRVFPGEPLAASLTLGDLADVAIFFGADSSTARTARPTTEDLAAATPFRTLKGRLAGVGWKDGGTHIYLLVALAREGRTDHWVVQGDSADVLSKAGWVFGPGGSVRLGQELSVEVQHLAPGSDATGIARDAPPEVAAFVRSGRVAYGIHVTLADGTRLPLRRQQ